MSEPIRSSRRTKVLIFLLTPIVVFGLLELGLRIARYRYEPGTARAQGLTHEELTQTDIYAPHPDLLWTVRPSSVIDAPQFGYPGIRTNAHGLRGEELPEAGAKATGELRVLCLGDSITFGLGLPDGETWPDRMAEALRSDPALEGRTIRVVNAATPGYSSVQGMRQLERLRALEFDVIVFYFGMNDARPMRVLPDSALKLPTEGASEGLAGLWKLRVFQLVQQAVTSLRQRSVAGTRVSPEEFLEHIRILHERDQEGGPQVIFVGEPECCELTIAQIECVVARAREEGVDVVAGPLALLSWIGPAPADVDLRGTRVAGNARPLLRFRSISTDATHGENTVMDLDALAADLDMLRDMDQFLDDIREGLPEESLDYAKFFGDTPPREVFVDNCHLSRDGARRAGQAIAREVIRRHR